MTALLAILRIMPNQCDGLKVEYLPQGIYNSILCETRNGSISLPEFLLIIAVGLNRSRNQTKVQIWTT